MCSFVVFSSDKLPLSYFDKALKNVVHRGPDNTYCSIESGLSWGFNRLSIMDLSSMVINHLNTLLVKLYAMEKYIITII